MLGCEKFRRDLYLLETVLGDFCPRQSTATQNDTRDAAGHSADHQIVWRANQVVRGPEPSEQRRQGQGTWQALHWFVTGRAKGGLLGVCNGVSRAPCLCESCEGLWTSAYQSRDPLRQRRRHRRRPRPLRLLDDAFAVEQVAGPDLQE